MYRGHKYQFSGKGFFLPEKVEIWLKKCCTSCSWCYMEKDCAFRLEELTGLEPERKLRFGRTQPFNIIKLHSEWGLFVLGFQYITMLNIHL